MLPDYKEGKRCRLNKALYGFREAGCQWNKKLHKVLKSLNLESTANETLFYFNTNGIKRVFLVMYVDGILYASHRESTLQEIRVGVKKAFGVKDLGLASFCLGKENNQGKGEIKLSQAGYVYMRNMV